MPSTSDVYNVFILPALPANWPSGSITNARLRGGIGIGFAWGNSALTSLHVTAEAQTAHRQIRFWHKGEVIRQLTSSPGMNVKLL